MRRPSEPFYDISDGKFGADRVRLAVERVPIGATAGSLFRGVLLDDASELHTLTTALLRANRLCLFRDYVWILRRRAQRESAPCAIPRCAAPTVTPSFGALPADVPHLRFVERLNADAGEPFQVARPKAKLGASSAAMASRLYA